MSERTLVPIFVFWAFLTIITPTLILLSENSKADFDLYGNITEGMKARRMIGYSYTQNHIIRTPPRPAMTAVAAEELELATAPEPSPSSGTSERATPPTGSHHNHTLTSNRTLDGVVFSSRNIQVEVKQTNIRQTST